MKAIHWEKTRLQQVRGVNLGPSYLGVFPPFLQSRWGGPAALQSIRGMDLVSVLAKQLDRQGSWVRLGRYHRSKQARAALRCTN